MASCTPPLLLDVKNVNNHNVDVYDDTDVSGSEFGDTDLSRFDPLTNNCFYAYNDIVFIKRFRVHTFQSRFKDIPDNLFLKNRQGTIRIVSSLFYDLYISHMIFPNWDSLGAGKRVDDAETETVLDILIKTVKEVKKSKDIPVNTDLWMPDACHLIKYSNKEAILFFDDDLYDPKKVEYYTLKQAFDVLYNSSNSDFHQNYLKKMIREDIPFSCSFEGTDAIYISTIRHQPFTSDLILDKLYIDQSKTLSIEEKRLYSVKKIYESSLSISQSKLVLPKKFRDARDPKIFSTKNYQKFIAEYMFHNNGLLCWHDAGTGKTLTSIMTIIAFLKNNTNGKVIIICPASLIPQWERVKREHIVPSSVDTDVKTFMDQYKRCLQLQESIGVFSYHNLNNVMKEWVMGNLEKKKKPFEDINQLGITSEMKRFLGSPDPVLGVFDEIHQVPGNFLSGKIPGDIYQKVVPQLKKIRSPCLQPTGGYWLRCLIVSSLSKALFLTATPIQNSITDLRPILQNIFLLHQDPAKRYEYLYWDNLVEYWNNLEMKDAIQDSWFQNSPGLPGKYPLNVTNQKTERKKICKETDSPAYYTLFTNGNDSLLRRELVVKDPLPDLPNQTKPQRQKRQVENIKRMEEKNIVYTFLNFVANFRGMIHRVRAVIPGRGHQKRNAIQQDEFPQEIMYTHYLNVDARSEYFKEYLKLVKEGAVLGPLKQYSTKSNDGFSYHQGSQLYTNQTKNTSHIYNIKTDPNSGSPITVSFSGTYDPSTIKKDPRTMTFESKNFEQVGRHTNPGSMIIIGGVEYPLQGYTSNAFTIATNRDTHEFRQHKTWNLDAIVIIRRNPVKYTIRGEFRINRDTLTCLDSDIDDIEISRVVNKKEIKEQIKVGYQVSVGGAIYVIVGVSKNVITVNRNIDTSLLKGNKKITELRIEKPFVREGDVPLVIRGDKAILQSRTPLKFQNFIKPDDSISFDINGRSETFIIKNVSGNDIILTRDTGINKAVSKWCLNTFLNPDAKIVTSKKTSLGDSKKITNPPDAFPDIIFSPKLDFLRGKIRASKTVVDDVPHQPGGLLRLFGMDKKVVIFTHYLENLDLLAKSMMDDRFFVHRDRTIPKPVVLSVNEGDLKKETGSSNDSSTNEAMSL